MNMPGFTAEASLHHSNVRYQTATKATFRGAIVQPAQFSDVVDPNPPPSLFCLLHPVFCYTDCLRKICRLRLVSLRDYPQFEEVCEWVPGTWDPVTESCEPF
jgi:hypothetical protein